MSVVSSTDSIYATRVLNIILKPFESQEAFKLGIIDKNGDELRKPRTEKEKEIYSPLHIVLFKLKQIITKLPGSDSRLKQIATALQFIRQKKLPSQYEMGLAEEISEEYLNRLIFVYENSLVFVEEELQVKKYIENIFEEGEAASPSAQTTTAAIEPKGEPAIYPKKKKIEEAKDMFETLYVCRNVLNADDIKKWANENGIKTTQDNMHVTVCYSKTPVEKIEPDNSIIKLPKSKRKLDIFGEQKDCLVLKIESSQLKSRWEQFIDAGATWSWQDYSPHITLTINIGDADIREMTPYSGEIELGPEVYSPVKENWHDEVTES